MQSVLAAAERTLDARGGVDADTPLMDAGLDSYLASAFADELAREVRRPVAELVVFECGTARLIARRLLEQCTPGAESAVGRSEDAAGVGESTPCRPSRQLQLAGLVGRWPGGMESEGAISRAACACADAIRPVPASRWVIQEGVTEHRRAQWRLETAGSDARSDAICSASYRPLGRQLLELGCVMGAERFANRSFGVSPSEAAAMDPQQRLLLEIGYGSLATAGFRRRELMDTDGSVYVGIMNADHAALAAGMQQRSLFEPSRSGGARSESSGPTDSGPTDSGPMHGSTFAATGSAISIASGRLSFVLGLHGPCASIDTACSSALAAIHAAATHAAERRGSVCSLVAAASLILSTSTSAAFARAGMLSPEARCKTFDERANGYVRSEATSALALMHDGDDGGEGGVGGRLQLAGCDLHQDGRSASLTAPSGVAQRSLIASVLFRAGRPDAFESGLIECHGTGTSLGDPTEVAALVGVGSASCAVLGTAKASIGHAEPAAGLAGVYYACLALSSAAGTACAQLRVLNFRAQPSARAASLCLSAQVLPSQRRATGIGSSMGVSSFGYSGTIAHLLLGRPTLVHSPLAPVCSRAANMAPRHERWARRTFLWSQPTHPLLQRRAGYTTILGHIPMHVAKAPLAAAYRSPLDGIFRELIEDHVVLGRVVCPAAAFIEMARAVACASSDGNPQSREPAAECVLPSSYFTSAGVGLAGLLFVSPLVLSSDGLASSVVDLWLGATRQFEVRCVVQAHAEGADSSASSSSFLHCTGSLARVRREGQGSPSTTDERWADGSLPVPFDIDDVTAALASRGIEDVGALAAYRSLDAVGLQYGPSYRMLGAIHRWVGDDPHERFVRMCGYGLWRPAGGVRTRRAGESCTHPWIHPCQLDGVFQVCVMPLPWESAAMIRPPLRLPFRIDQIALPRAYHVVDAALLSLRSHGASVPESAPPILDGLVVCAHGRCGARMEGFHSRAWQKKASMHQEQGAAHAPRGIQFQIAWLQSRTMPPADPAVGPRDCIMVICAAPPRKATAGAPAVPRVHPHSGGCEPHAFAVLPTPWCQELVGLEVALILLVTMEAGGADASRESCVWLVSSAAHVGSTGGTFRHAGVSGLGRVARIELPTVPVRCLDLGMAQCRPKRAIAMLTAARSLDAAENEIAASFHRVGHEHKWHLPRLVEVPAASSQPVCLCLHARGSIDGLHVVTQRLSLEPLIPEGHVGVALRAAGLNFRDVLMVLGLYPEPQAQVFAPGDDCAGVLCEVDESVPWIIGEAVFGSPGLVHGISCLASRLRVSAQLVVRTPEGATPAACTSEPYILQMSTPNHPAKSSVLPFCCPLGCA